MGSSNSRLPPTIPTESEISGLTLSDFNRGPILGEGAFGKVYSARHIARKTEIALKIMKIRSDRSPQEHWGAIRREIRVLKALDPKSPFTISFYAAFFDQSDTALVFELVSGGSLYSKLGSRGKELTVPMREKHAKFYIAEIACGLESLRSRRIVHRDLKLDNILLTGDGHVKIVDFGLATILVDGYDRDSCGAVNIRSPQMLRGEPYTYATDWYALGVGMYQIVVGHDPCYGLVCDRHSKKDLCSTSCLARSILRNNVPYPLRLSPDCQDLLSWLMRDDEDGRIKSLDEISRHPWFIGLDWEIVKRGRARL